MKNKKFMRTFLVMMAVVFSMTAFSMTAYAGGAPEQEEPEQPAIQEPEPTPDPVPLTPEGNLSLVDDIEGKTAEDKQFITVVSKGGNYFYIIIDRAADGENTVHFLNQVDEADLMALTEDGKSQTTPPPTICTCTEKCEDGKVNVNCSLCKTDQSACTGKETMAEPEPEQTEKKGGSPILILLVVLALSGGGAFYYFKFMKPGHASKGNDDLSDLDFEDEYEDTEIEQLEDEPEQEDENE